MHRREAFRAVLHRHMPDPPSDQPRRALASSLASRRRWHGDCFIKIVCGMFSSPLVRHFLLDRRVRERKGPYAFFYACAIRI